MCVRVCVLPGNNREWNGVEMVQVENKTHQWLGASLDASSTVDSTAVIVVRSIHSRSAASVSLQLFECVATVLTLHRRLFPGTVSNRPLNPLNAFTLAPQIRLPLYLVIFIYLITYLLAYLN